MFSFVATALEQTFGLETTAHTTDTPDSQTGIGLRIDDDIENVKSRLRDLKTNQHYLENLDLPYIISDSILGLKLC